jgi:glycosyltransferase involved in cell wall biosynthesis
MKNPLISIWIPTFNRPEYLTELIASILKQTYTNFEIVIYDDWSPKINEISKIIDWFNDSRIRFYAWENVWFIKNWNRVLSKCNGEYIKIVWDDDILLEDCIRIQLEHILSNPEVWIICCNYYTIDSKWIEINNDNFNINTFRLFKGNYIESWATFSKNYFLWKRIVWLPTSIMFRKSLSDKIWWFDENIWSPADIDYWLRLTKVSDFMYIDNILIKMRWHSDNLSKKLELDIELYENLILLLKKNYMSFYIYLSFLDKIIIFLRYLLMSKKYLNSSNLKILFKNYIDLFILIFIKWLSKK